MDSNNPIKLKILTQKVQEELKQTEVSGLIPEYKDMEIRLKEFMAELKFEPEQGKEYTVRNLARVVFPLMRDFAMGNDSPTFDEILAEIEDGFNLKYKLSGDSKDEVSQVLSATSSRKLLAQDLYKVLKTIPENGIVTYRHLEERINHPIRGNADFIILKYARMWAKERDGIIFDTVYRLGLRRLSDSGKLNEMNKFRKRIDKTATDAASTLITVSYDKLTQGEKRQFAFEVAWAGAIRMISNSEASKKVLEHFKNESPRKQGYDPARTLALFGKKS